MGICLSVLPLSDSLSLTKRKKSTHRLDHKLLPALAFLSHRKGWWRWLAAASSGYCWTQARLHSRRRCVNSQLSGHSVPSQGFLAATRMQNNNNKDSSVGETGVGGWGDRNRDQHLVYVPSGQVALAKPCPPPQSLFEQTNKILNEQSGTFL